VKTLRHRVAVSQACRARPIGCEDALVRLGVGLREPGEKRGPDIERDPLVVVDDSFALGRLEVRQKVGPIGLGVHALVPVVERSGARLSLDATRPGILARRLIEVTVDDDGRRAHGPSTAEATTQ
jgi:hypothetical protein